MFTPYYWCKRLWSELFWWKNIRLQKYLLFLSKFYNLYICIDRESGIKYWSKVSLFISWRIRVFFWKISILEEKLNFSSPLNFIIYLKRETFAKNLLAGQPLFQFYCFLIEETYMIGLVLIFLKIPFSKIRNIKIFFVTYVN